MAMLTALSDADFRKLAESYCQMYNYRKAAYYADKAVALNHNNDNAHLIKAYSLMCMEEYDEAQRYLEQYLKNVPQSSVAHLLLADCLRYNGELPRALEAANMSVSLDPEYFLGYFSRALIFHDMVVLEKEKADLEMCHHQESGGSFTARPVDAFAHDEVSGEQSGNDYQFHHELGWVLRRFGRTHFLLSRNWRISPIIPKSHLKAQKYRFKCESQLSKSHLKR